MAGYLRVFLAITVFWSMAHFQNVPPKPFTGVTSVTTRGLRHENKQEDTSFTRQVTLGGELTNIQKELASLSEADKILLSNITELKQQMDKAHDEQNYLLHKLQKDIMDQKEGQDKATAEIKSDMIGKLRSLESTDANLTTDLNSLQVNLSQFSSDIQQKLAAAKEDQEKKLESHVNITREELQKIESKLSCLPHRFHFQSSCYHVVDESLTWYDAKVKCRSLGGNLAEVESSEENDYLKRIANFDGADNFWLGGTDGETENTWIWSSSSRGLEFTDWNTGEPNNKEQREHCLELRKNYNYKWNDSDCRSHFKSVCEMSK